MSELDKNEKLYFKGKLLPAIIQDYNTKTVLMLGYMNLEAYKISKKTGIVTFFSRSKNSIWVKGHTSGNKMIIKSMKWDCDCDTILIKVKPLGPACHKGTDNCWGEKNIKHVEPGESLFFIKKLIDIIANRIEKNNEKSYVSRLYHSGINKVAQKVGEEATELVIEAIDTKNQDKFVNEAADLFFHYLILLNKKGVSFDDVNSVLKERHNK